MTENYRQARIHLLIVIIGIVLVFVAATAYMIYAQQYQQLISAHQHKTVVEADLIGASLRDFLLRNDYSEARDFLVNWQQNHANVLRLALQMDNGVDLYNYQSQAAKPKFEVTHRIEYGNRHLFLHLNHNTDTIDTALNTLAGNLVTFSSLLVVLMGATLWFVLFRWSVKPMEHEITLRTQALLEAREAAEAAHQAKSAFLANMSHEIRTPLNAIIGMSELAVQSGVGPAQHQYLEKINSAAQSLLEILGTVLDFSKIEAGRLQIENTRFALDEVLENVCALVAVPAQKKLINFALSWEGNVPRHLRGDSTRLTQVLLNLLSNAIKFAPEGEVGLHVRVVTLTDRYVILRFVVCDNGIGLSREQQEQIFEPFMQADVSTTRRYGGSGLGLAISRRLATLMDGELTVQSVPDLGSSFYLTARFGMDETSQTLLTCPVADQRILLVDTNPLSIDAIRNSLSNCQAHIDCAYDVPRAISLLQQSAYQWLFIDSNLFGNEALQKALQGVPGARIAALVAYFENSSEKPQLAQFVLAKPVTPRALRNVFSGQPQQPGKRNITGFNGQHVLLVEDNDLNRDVATTMLMRAGLKITAAENGKIALEKLAQQTFDLVLMDLQMPELDGLETTRRIRANPAWQRMPIIAMTANVLQEDREACLRAGMDDHIAKPIKRNKMLETIQYWLTGQQPPPLVEEPAEPPTPTAAVLNYAEGLARFDNDKAAYHHLLNKFMLRHRDDVSSIRTALANQQSAEALRLAHSLKGAAGNLSADALHISSRELEEAFKTNQAYETQLMQIQTDIAAVCAAIAELPP